MEPSFLPLCVRRIICHNHFGVCPPHRRLQFHVAFTHVSHWPHTLQCLPRNSLPTCLKNRLKRWPERGPAPLLDSNVCCDVCCSYQDYACPFSRTFPEFASTYCLPGRAFRHPLFTDRPLRRNLASFALLNILIQFLLLSFLKFILSFPRRRESSFFLMSTNLSNYPRPSRGRPTCRRWELRSYRPHPKAQ